MSNPNAARLGDDIIHTSILADILEGAFEAAICVAVGVVVVAAAAPLAAAAATAAPETGQPAAAPFPRWSLPTSSSGVNRLWFALFIAANHPAWKPRCSRFPS